MPKDGSFSQSFKKAIDLSKWARGYHAASDVVDKVGQQKEHRRRKEANDDFLTRLRGAEARDHSRMQPQAKGAEEPKPAVPEFRAAPGEETWREIDEARRVAKLEAREAAARTRIQQRPRNLSRGELELASEVCSRHANC